MLLRDPRGETQTRREPCEGRRTDGRDAATSPGPPGGPEAGRGRKDPPLEPLEGAQPCPTWISVVLPCLDLSSPAPPGSQQPFPTWISVALPCPDLRGPAPPGSEWPCPAWISVVLPCLDLSVSASSGSQRSCPSWNSVFLPLLGLSSPVPPGSQCSCPAGFVLKTLKGHRSLAQCTANATLLTCKEY